jgi:HD-GYP domain-containing protein (c-di-GMP phosphodiesterase class II)
MLEKVEQYFRDLLSALQTAKLYSTEHPMFKKSVDKAYDSLQEVLGLRDELILGFVGDEIAFEKEIFFDLSKMVRPAILYLKERGIERIAFYRGAQKEELLKFIVFIASDKDEAKKDAQGYLSLIGVKNIAVGKIKGATVLDSQKAGGVVSGIYESSLDKVSESLTSVLDTGAVDHMVLKFSINNIMENLGTQYQEFMKFTTLKRYDIGTYVHLLNVCILSMYFSSKLGFAREDALDVGIAGLFHDIGKLYISRKIIRKADKLTDEGLGLMKSHPVLGAEILLNYSDHLGILPVVVCFEHHLKYNMKGYPKRPFTQSPHIATMIVTICDVYDALSQRRGYKADYPPDVIYTIINKEKGESFDPELVDKFFKYMGVWPIGSIVALNDGRVAVVNDEHDDDIFSPTVRVIHPENVKETIDLRQTKGSLKIERFLNPWNEGKEYLRLVR